MMTNGYQTLMIFIALFRLRECIFASNMNALHTEQMRAAEYELFKLISDQS